MKPISFLEGNSGGLSATRLRFLLWVVSVLCIWIYINIESAIPARTANRSVAVIGLLKTGKTAQRFGENPDHTFNSSPEWRLTYNFFRRNSSASRIAINHRCPLHVRSDTNQLNTDE